MNISKECLKDSVRMTVEAFEELKKEGINLNIGSDDLIKVAISLYIQGSRTNGYSNGNGNGNGHAAPEKKEPTPMTINFGKHKGKILAELVKIDRSYVNWLADKSEIEKIRTEAKRVLEANPIQTGKVTIPKPKAFQK